VIVVVAVWFGSECAFNAANECQEIFGDICFGKQAPPPGGGG
jgi:hypothetical protein